jgi:hypothetical protein
MSKQRLPPVFSQSLQRPEGAVELNKFEIPDLWNEGALTSIFFEVVAGGQYFRLERSPSLQVAFYHSSPGTGTRAATVDLRNMARSKEVFLAFTWSPAETKLYIGPYGSGGALLSATGVASPRTFVVGEKGTVFELGSPGVNVIDTRAYNGGQLILRPTAVQGWQATKTAIEILLKGTSQDGHMFDVVVSNFAISALVTGFEVFSKTRFVELQREGIVPNIQALNQLLPRKLRDPERVLPDTKNPHDVLRFVQKVAEHLNFQNYGKCRNAFRVAYGIDFTKFGISEAEINSLRKFIDHRHRVIHVSPLIGTLNPESLSKEQPIFVNKTLANKAVACFDSFVQRVHAFTLSLNRAD